MSSSLVVITLLSSGSSARCFILPRVEVGGPVHMTELVVLITLIARAAVWSALGTSGGNHSHHGVHPADPSPRPSPSPTAPARPPCASRWRTTPPQRIDLLFNLRGRTSTVELEPNGSPPVASLAKMMKPRS